MPNGYIWEPPPFPKPKVIPSIIIHATLELRIKLMSEGNWPFGCKCLDKEYWSIPENHRRFLQIFENSEVPKVETVPKRRSNLISMERFENPQYVEEEYRLHLYCDSDEAKEIGAGYDLRIENTTLI